MISLNRPMDKLNKKMYITLKVKTEPRRSRQDTKCGINRYFMCLINYQNESRECPLQFLASF